MGFPLQANRGNALRKQSFSGKTLSFVEIIFDDTVTQTDSSPEGFESVWKKVTQVVQSQTGNGGTILAMSYDLNRKATDADAARVAAIDADASIDVFQYIVEGGPELFDEPASAGAATGDDSTVKSGAETDLETDILAAIDQNDSSGSVGVTIRSLPADGSAAASGASNSIFGMFDPRGAA